jgi:type IV pilus assembly protein PilY1
MLTIGPMRAQPGATMTKGKQIHLWQLLVAWLCCASSNFSAAEDIDLYSATQASTAGLPTVIVILDNTANWGSTIGATKKFNVVQTALAAAIGAQPANTLRIGLMLFNETGGTSLSGGQPTGSHDGAYVRYAVRTMTSTTKTEFINLINGLNITADKGANTQNTLALEEARRYFGGLRVLNGNNTQAKLDPASQNAAHDTYLSPDLTGCGRAFVLYISNGPPSSNEDSAALTLAKALNGGVAPTQLTLPAPQAPPTVPANQQWASNWMDEYAGLIRRSPFPTAATGSPNAITSIITYGISVHDPVAVSDNGNTDNSARALILNASKYRGGGKYFDATDATSLQIALQTVFAEVQAVNSVFVASSLPISVNTQGTYLNQIYMGMFRPDASAAPRWVGNMKEYKFAYTSDTGLLELVDSNGQAALNPGTGFMSPAATSYWSTASTTGPVLPSGTSSVNFWTNSPSGSVPNALDSPDGEVVEKGAAAQRLRADNLGTQTARSIYSCPLTGCSAGLLSGFAFTTTAITGLLYQAAFGAASATELQNIVEWVRGADNAGNESSIGPGGAVTVRGSVHGDVLHSRPIILNYDATNSNIVAYYGANDGTLRAVRAGTGSNGGTELWSFVAPEFFPKLKRLRDNSPALQIPSPSSGLSPAIAPNLNQRPKDYFFDGSISVHQVRDSSGTITKAYLYAAARRGGNMIYAFDITNPNAPAFMWKRSTLDGSFGSTHFADMALTFSAPRVGKVKGNANPVLIFGGGYHGGYVPATGLPLGEDADPPGTCSGATAILGGLTIGCGNRVFVLDAVTGAEVHSFPSGSDPQIGSSVASEVALIDTDADGYIDRLYAVDTGGKVWRMDVNAADPDAWRLYEFALVTSPRKFLYKPDVVVTKQFAAVLVGSGDREKPLKETGVDRFYMFKDKITGMDATGMVSIAGDVTTSGNMADSKTLSAAELAATLASPSNNGWFYTMAAGEKIVNAALTAGAVVYFSTNTPSPPTVGSCLANLGVAKAYGLLFSDGMPGRDLNGDGVFDASDAAVTLTGGGLPPSPIAGLVNVLDSATGSEVTVPFIIGSGGAAGGVAGVTSQSAPAKIVVNMQKTRKKKYWYMKSDQ